jgi:hypothetical protein
MLAEFDEYRAILFQHFQCPLCATLVAVLQSPGVLFRVIALVLEGNPIAGEESVLLFEEHKLCILVYIHRQAAQHSPRPLRRLVAMLDVVREG